MRYLDLFLNTVNAKIESELNAASVELQEATAALAKLGNDYEKARHAAQIKVTTAAGKISALLSISKAQSEG